MLVSASLETSAIDLWRVCIDRHGLGPLAKCSEPAVSEFRLLWNRAGFSKPTVHGFWPGQPGNEPDGVSGDNAPRTQRSARHTEDFANAVTRYTEDLANAVIATLVSACFDRRARPKTVQPLLGIQVARFWVQGALIWEFKWPAFGSSVSEILPEHGSSSSVRVQNDTQDAQNDTTGGPNGAKGDQNQGPDGAKGDTKIKKLQRLDFWAVPGWPRDAIGARFWEFK